MLAAIELEFVKAAQLVAFLGAFRANKPKPSSCGVSAATR